MSADGVGRGVPLPVQVKPGETVHWGEEDQRLEFGDGLKALAIGAGIALPGAAIGRWAAPSLGAGRGALAGFAAGLAIGLGRELFDSKDASQHPLSWHGGPPPAVTPPVLPAPKAGAPVNGYGPGPELLTIDIPDKFPFNIATYDSDQHEPDMDWFGHPDRKGHVNVRSAYGDTGTSYPEFSSLDSAMAEAERLRGDQAVFRRGADRWFVMQTGEDSPIGSGQPSEWLAQAHGRRDTHHLDGILAENTDRTVNGQRYHVEALEIGDAWFTAVGNHYVRADVAGE